MTESIEVIEIIEIIEIIEEIEPSNARTPRVIAAEIMTIKQQAEKILLVAAIEIGRRLKEAKTLVKHGEWGKWLKEQVNFSQNNHEGSEV